MLETKTLAYTSNKILCEKNLAIYYFKKWIGMLLWVFIYF